MSEQRAFQCPGMGTKSEWGLGYSFWVEILHVQWNPGIMTFNTTIFPMQRITFFSPANVTVQ